MLIHAHVARLSREIFKGEYYTYTKVDHFVGGLLSTSLAPKTVFSFATELDISLKKVYSPRRYTRKAGRVHCIIL